MEVAEEKELNRELRKMQQRAKRLILSDYYDYISLSELQYSILLQLTNARTVNDINSYLWNSGAIKLTLNSISEGIKAAKGGR